MRTALLYLLLLAILAAAVAVGFHRAEPQSRTSGFAGQVPSVGSLQVLNGCGMGGAAGAVADFLRRSGFDVKNIGNAPSWNYPFTMVVSRSADMSNARHVAQALKTRAVFMMRTGDVTYDVVVIVGPDYRKDRQ